MPQQHNGPYWPPHLPRTFRLARNTLADNLAIAAARYGDQAGIAWFGCEITYGEWQAVAWRFAGWLQQVAGVQAGDRVAVVMQNCPQWLMAYFGILRADAVVVPVSPMYGADELRAVLADCGACAIVCAADLAETAVAAARGTAVRQIVAAGYSDYLPPTDAFDLPHWIAGAAPRTDGCVRWLDAVSADHTPRAATATSGDIAVLPYTSGSTGVPKGCIHTHASFMHTAQGGGYWYGVGSGTVVLGLAPMYHVSGMSQSINVAVMAGATIVVQPRWDRKLAAQLIARYRVRHASIAPTAIIDLLANDEHRQHDLTSLRCVAFGGAPMPEQIFNRLQRTLGLAFIEGYGMTETAAAAIINPLCRPKRQCLGLAFFNTDVRIVDPNTLQLQPDGQSGEILIRGPQVFKGYWGKPGDTAQAFAEIDGMRFLRSGDIGFRDDEGYFFMSDRLKRMINASGFKVWPSEIENKLYDHPAIAEACVIRLRDPYRGETVKALVVLRAEARGALSEDDVIAWSRAHMAAYKYPRVVEFVDALPKALNGKILWRDLQEREDARAQASHIPSTP